MTTSYIHQERSNGVLTLRIDRREKKNSLTTEMYDTMADAVRAASDDAGVGAILITGSEQCFTAGNDLSEFMERAQASQQSGAPERSAGLDFVGALMDCKTPVVAAVNGIAIGIGTTMLMHCDFVHAGRSAQFRTPFVDLGLCPEAASSLLLPLVAGPRRAADLLLAGEALSAEEALACGLINRMHDDADTEAQARAQAERLAAKPRESVRLSKHLMRRYWQDAVAEMLAYERDRFGERLTSDEAREAFAGFFSRSRA